MCTRWKNRYSKTRSGKRVHDTSESGSGELCVRKNNNLPRFGGGGLLCVSFLLAGSRFRSPLIDFVSSSLSFSSYTIEQNYSRLVAQQNCDDWRIKCKGKWLPWEQGSFRVPRVARLPRLPPTTTFCSEKHKEAQFRMSKQTWKNLMNISRHDWPGLNEVTLRRK